MNHFDDRVRLLSEQLRVTDSFTVTISQWSPSPIEYVSARHEHCPATREYAAGLDVPQGSSLIHRHGYLETASADNRRTVADVRAVVASHRLDPQDRNALASKSIALGLILRRHGAQRRTHAVSRVSEVDSCGQQLLRVSATVTIGDNLIAMVSEIVYRELIVLSSSRDAAVP